MNFGVKTIFCVLVISVGMNFWQGVLPEGNFLGVDNLLSIVMGGILAGTGIALCFTQGGSTGGTDIVAMIINKYRTISYGKILIYSDFVIIASSLLVGKGISAVIYGYVLTAVVGYTVDMIMAGNQQSSQVLIVTHDYEKMADAIAQNIHRGVTLIDSQGWYSKERSKIVMVVCRKRETAMILKFVKTIDPDAFMTGGFGDGRLRQGFPGDQQGLMPRYADIVLPLAQPAYTFAVPEGMPVTEGQAVAVQFGPRKFYTGIVWRLHDRRPDFPRIKSIQRILYDSPLLSAAQRSLWEWMASYYLCSAGEVMRVALPRLMKPSGDTEEAFSEEEFRPRKECYVSLARELWDETAFHETCERLERRAPKQYEALLEIAAAGDGERIATGEIARRLLRADYGVLRTLERKGLIVTTEHERTVEYGGSAFRLPS